MQMMSPQLKRSHSDKGTVAKMTAFEPFYPFRFAGINLMAIELLDEDG
jgi:hypothetical protein